MFYKGSIKNVFMGRLAPGSDLLEGIKSVLVREGVDSGTVSVIGALRSAKLGYYNQETREYESHEVGEGVEILHCTGNISLLEGQPFPHLHVMLGNREGKASGGHLFAGEVFVAEYIVYEFDGQPLLRGEDEETGLKLWPADR